MNQFIWPSNIFYEFSSKTQRNPNQLPHQLASFFLLLSGTSLMPQTTNQRYALDGGLAGFGFSHATWPSLESYSTPKGFEKKKPLTPWFLGCFLEKP